MLQSFRDNLRGVTAAIVVGLLIIPFAFFGVESLFVSGSGVQEEVNVNGEKITKLEIDRGVEYQKQRILSKYKDVDPKMLDDDKLRDAVIDQLIRQKLLTHTAAENGMAISDKTFNEMIVSNESFQENGKFNSDLYQYYLDRLGFTARSYRETVMDEMLASHLTAGIQQTSFTTDIQMKDFSRLALQQRSFDYLELKPGDVSDIEVTAEEETAYYNENQQRFTQPDKVVVEYIELTPELLESGISVPESEVDTRLAEEQKKNQQAGQSWRLAHILIDPAADSNAEETAKSIEQRLADGEDFAALAKEYSSDFGSAEMGGELGSFTKETLPQGFEDAIAGLKAGEVSEPVKLDTGIHIIKVLDESELAENGAPLTREEVIGELKRERAMEKLPAKLDQMKEETFSVDSLAAAAETLGLPVKESQPFSAEGGSGIASFPAVTKAAFSEEVYKEGYASEVLEVGENHYVVIKVKQAIPSHVAPEEEVADQIRQVIKLQKAQTVVRKRGDSIIAALQSGEGLGDMAARENLEIKSEEKMTRFDPKVPQSLAKAVFQPPISSRVPFYGIATALNGDLFIYGLREIVPGDPKTLLEDERKAMRASLRQVNAAAEFIAYLDTLKASADIKRMANTESSADTGTDTDETE